MADKFDFSGLSDEDLDRVIESGGTWTPPAPAAQPQQMQQTQPQASPQWNNDPSVDTVYGDSPLEEAAKGAGRAAKAIGGAFVGLGSGAVRLAGTPVRALTGWDGLHRVADAIDSGYEDWGSEALASELPDDDWGRVLGGFGEKMAGTAGTLGAMAAGGGLAKLGAAGKFGAASKAVGTAGAALQKSLPLIFGNDAAVRTYDTAKENGSGTARALGLASVNGAIHYFGFKAFENQSLNKMLGMPQEMTAMMPGWANAAREGGAKTFTELASGVRNGMYKYILAERAKGALKAGGIMGLQNFLSSVPTQMAEGAGVGDVDWGRAVSEGVGGVEEGALMEGLMGGAAALKTPKAARKFIADTYFRNGYKLPNGQHVPGLLHSEEGRSFVMKQNPEMQRRILDILDHGGKVTKGELNAACLPPDMTEAELREFKKDWRKDLASEWDRAAEPEALGDGEELEGNEPVIPREQQMRNRAKVNEMRDHDQRVAEAEEAERARAEEQAADDAAVAAEEANWAEADAERAAEQAGAEQLAREEAYPQPVAEQPAAPEQAPVQESTEPPVAERSNRLRRNLKPNFRHQGENQQQPQQEIPNETGNVPVEAQPEPPVQDAGRGGQQQAPQAADGSVEGEAPRGEVPTAGEVAEARPAEAKPVAPAPAATQEQKPVEQKPVSKSDRGGQKLTGSAKEEATPQKAEATPPATQTEPPSAEPSKTAPASAPRADGTTTPPQSAEPAQGAETAAGGATGKKPVNLYTDNADVRAAFGDMEIATSDRKNKIGLGKDVAKRHADAKAKLQGLLKNAATEDLLETFNGTVGGRPPKGNTGWLDYFGEDMSSFGSMLKSELESRGYKYNRKTGDMDAPDAPTQGNKLRRGKKGKKLEAQEPKADVAPKADAVPAAPATQEATPEREPVFENEQLEKAYRMIQSGVKKDVRAGEDLALETISKMRGRELQKLYTMTPTDDAFEKIIDIATGEVNDRMISDEPIPEGTIPDRKDTTPATPEAPAANDNKLKPATVAKRGRKAKPNAAQEAAPAPTADDQTQPASQFRDENGNMKKTLRGAVERIASAIGNRTGKGAITPEEADAIVNGIAESPEAKHNRTRQFFTPLVTDAEWQNSLGVDAESAKNLRDAVMRAKTDSEMAHFFVQVDKAVKKAKAGKLSPKDAVPLNGKISEGLEKAEREGRAEAAKRLREALEVIKPVVDAVSQEDVDKFNRSAKGKKLHTQLDGSDRRRGSRGKTVSLDTKDGTVDVGADGRTLEDVADEISDSSHDRRTLKPGESYGKGFTAKSDNDTTGTEGTRQGSTGKGGGRGGNRVLRIEEIDGDDVFVSLLDSTGRERGEPQKMTREQWEMLAKAGKSLNDADPSNPQVGDNIMMSRGNAESPADRDAKFAADADYQRWLKSRKANDAEPLRQRYEMEQAKALGDAYQNAVRGVDFEYVDRDYDPAIDGGGDERKSVGGIYTGSAADYDKPSLLKVGTGEGTQVYGWGLYGSTERGVAEGYARQGRNLNVAAGDAEYEMDGKSLDRTNNVIDSALTYLASERMNTQKAIEEINRAIDGFKKQLEDTNERLEWDKNNFRLQMDAESLPKRISHLNEVKGFIERDGGKIRQVFPSENIYEQTFFTNREPGDESHLLKWYEPADKNVLSRLQNALADESSGKYSSFERWVEEEAGGRDVNAEIDSLNHIAKEMGLKDARELFEREREKYFDLSLKNRNRAFMEDVSNPTGEDVYNALAERLGGAKEASEWLAEHDIDGIKYPVDSYGGKAVKDGNKAGWNYVSFRDDNIRVDHKWTDGNLRYLRERGTGTVLGIFDRDTGKLKLFRGASWKTLNHELGGHATMRLAEQEAERGNRALLDKINESIDNAPQWLKDEVKSRYPDADEATLRDEIWAALRERPSEAMQKYVKTLQGRKWYNRAWDAIKTAWRGILSRMGFNRADLSGIDKMTPDEFNEFLDKAMIGGKTLGRIETQGGESSVRMARGPAAPSNKDVKLYLDDKEGFWKKMRRMFQDKNIILRDVEERLGITKKEESAYYAKDAAYGKNEHELTYLQKQEVEPIVAKIEKSGGSLGLFSAYLYARHSGERNAVMKAEKGIDNGSGMTKDQADAIFSAVDRLGLRAAFEDAARDVWAMNRKYLQRRADSGRMTQAEVKFLLDRYKHYVPLRNDMSNEELEMFNSSTGGWKRNELRTAKGRMEAADDPFAFSIVQSEEAIRASNANEARRKFAGVVRRAAAQGAPIGEVVDGENKGGATWSFVFKDGGRIDTGSPMRLASERDDIILFKENGKLKAIKIDPGKNGRGLDLARAVTDKDVVRFNRHLEWIPRATRWMSAMRTQYVPTFIIRNMKADNLEVLLNALSERGVKGFKFFGKFVANEVSVAKGVKEYFKTGKSSDKYVQEAVENGLLTGGGMAAEGFSETTRRLSDTLAALRGGRKGAVGMAFGAAKDLISLLNSCAEYNTRMGVYKTLREEGMSVADAVSYARDVTVNFNRKGYLTPYTNAAFMFSNASIQGMGRAFKSIKSEHGKEVVAGLFLVGAAQAMLDDWLGHDDNDKSGGADSRNLTEFDKSHSLGVALPSGHRVKTGIRNPWALPVYMGRKTVELVKGLTSGEDAMKDIANEVGQFATEPVGGNGFGSVSEFLQTLAPTIIDPFVQWGTGKDYRGHDRVNKSFNQYEPDSWNGRNNTPEAYKAIAKALNFVSGGGGHRKGAFDTSPENWKLLTETVFGGVLTDVNNVISAGEHAMKAARGQPASQIVRDVPFVRDTFTNMPDSTTRYYEAVDSYNADKNEFKKTTELGRRAEMKKDHPYLTAKKGRVDALIEQVQELTHRERGEVKVGQKWVPAKVEPSEERKEAFRKRRLRLQAEVLRILGK